MAVTFACIRCGEEIVVRHLGAGEPAQCKRCGTLNTVPTGAGIPGDAQEPGAHATASPPAGSLIAAAMMTTAFQLDGFRVTRSLGIVRGLTVRSRSVLGSIGAEVQQMFGGQITIYIKLCEESRAEAFDLMITHAHELGANALIGVRYDANEVSDGVTEVLCYGTAVVVEVAPQPIDA